MVLNEDSLDMMLSEPAPETVELMRRLDGDLMILGVAGKMGVTLALMAAEACRRAGVKKRIYGVARFSEPGAVEKLTAAGIEAVRCDLLDREAVGKLPTAANVIYMAGRKFGTDGSEELTWAMNTVVPAYVAENFPSARIVVFSTGCVYPLVTAAMGGCAESVAPRPVGEYAQSCLGRERTFQYFSRRNGTEILLYRLNYAVDLRYGVLHDIGLRIINGEPVDASVGCFNVIWQGDANNYALRCLEHCASPASIMNITGAETVTVRYAAEYMAALLGKKATYSAPVFGENCYLNDAGKSFELFGYPGMPLRRMLEMQAQWLADGGRSLGKPTHFEVNDGKF